MRVNRYFSSVVRVEFSVIALINIAGRRISPLVGLICIKVESPVFVIL
jgi:hypothetical protein